MPPDTAVAVREDQHPIIAAIDGRMGEIAEILPEGMRPDRFRKVVVQALLRNPALWDCTPISIITAITEAAEVGIEPTGVLGKGWLLPYRGEAKFIPGWRGFVDLCWRSDRLLLTPELVRAGDHFEYRRGTGQYLHHIPVLDDPDREADDSNVTFAYVVVRFPDGREDFEVMSRAALDRIRDVSLRKVRDLKKRDEAIWNVHPGEMMKKTPIRRIAKRLPLSPAVQAMLARDEDADYDTPVERVANPKREQLRDRIAARTAALRGEPNDPVESEGADLDGAGVPASQPVGGAPTPSAGGSPAGDPWMRRLHAVGNEHGMDHDALHDWAIEHFGVASLKDLTPPQRATFMELVERMPVVGTGAADQSVPAPSTPQREGSSAPATTQVTEDAAVPLGTSSGPAPAPSLDDVLAVSGGEVIPPKPGTKAYKDLPSGADRAVARAYWDQLPEPETMAAVLGAPEPDR